ncbi:hypothetical protein APHAL10511_000954 [Amanita phalloides]|nr:hypothetical protein APHAL10511_000954 [Amanita phalloides]
MTLSVFYGAVINPVSLTEYKVFPRCLLVIGPEGTIICMVKDVASHLLQDTLAQEGLVDIDIYALRDGEFIIPGFIDTHTHAPQFPITATGQEFELLKWLEDIVFPMEKKFANLDFASRTYKIVVRRSIDLGTTTSCYYGSLHYEATRELADIVHAYGQRAFIGKCNMNRVPPTFDDEGRPIEMGTAKPNDDYIEPDTQRSIETTVKLIKHIRSLPPQTTGTGPEPLVKPILTPRFALSCTDDLLAGLGELALRDPSLNIQTHISENLKEVEDTLKAFPYACNYADVYNIFKLLRHNTILAHGVHLTDDELMLIKEKDAGISHCPVSNYNLRSGVAQIGKYLDRGIKVGLGTDVSGGFSPSMLTVIQHASTASKVLAFRSVLPRVGKDESEPTPPSTTDGGFADRLLRVATLFYLATVGGAQVCDIDKHVGSFAVGKSFDALLVSVRGDTGNLTIWNGDIGHSEHEKDKPEEFFSRWLERFLFGGDDRNILRVYVQGRLIGGKSFHHK